MVEAVCMLGGLGLVVGTALAAASRIFYVFVDPQVEAVDELLPGANCGGCGLPGCSANAEAIVKGQARPDSCVAAGEDTAIAIAQLMGVSIEAKEPDIALPDCTYGMDKADTKYLYKGLLDCRAAVLLHGGTKECNVGCLGLGTCARACPFNAIVIGESGLPIVDHDACTGCGTCERVCPKNIIHLSSVTRRMLLEYTTDHCTTPCQRACPAGIDIRAYIAQIQLGSYEGAVRVIKERNPFPTVIGRICPRPCENECRRQYVDEPVAINFLKRYAADVEYESREHVFPFMAPKTGRSVAVIGGGVEGLSAAFFLTRLGHAATVFETQEQLGGLLRVAIAKNRLPDEVLDWDIEGILEMGVTAKTNMTLGRDFTVETLLSQEFEAVLLAAGGWDSRLSISDYQTQGVVPGMHIMIDLLQDDTANITCQPETIIVGGGPLIMDAYEACLAKGAEQITLLLRESLEKTPLSTEQIDQLNKKGVNILHDAALNRLYGKDNTLTEVEYIQVTSGSTHSIPAGTLVLSSGRFPELIIKKLMRGGEESSQEDMAHNDYLWEAFLPYKSTDQKDQKGLLAEGDTLTDYAAAIKAIAAGRRAAASIHKCMYDMDLTLPANVVNLNSPVQNVDHVTHVRTESRQIMPMRTMDEAHAAGVEVEKGFSEDLARREAGRCLQCGLICYEKTDRAPAVTEI